MKRIPALDSLRALAFAAVFLHHAYHIPLLWAGVDCFFVLSGLLITTILKTQSRNLGALKSFYVRRARRILPPYVLSLIVASVTVGVAWKTDWPWLTFFAANVGYSFNFMRTTALSPLWSLSVEEQFYLIWPFLLLFVSLTSVRKTMIGIVLAAPILRFLCTPLFPTEFPIYFLTPFRADLLAVGGLIALSLETYKGRWKVAVPWLFSFGLIILATLALLGYRRTTGDTRIFNTFGFEAMLAIASAAVIYVATLEEGIVHTILMVAPIRYIGRISYFAYLIHFPMLNWIHNPVVALGATLGLSGLSWELMEKHLIVRKIDEPRDLLT
jgi:peptidoglycan/LPS O-acetylase OafA/YrhL